jgi:hypothetical protein
MKNHLLLFLTPFLFLACNPKNTTDEPKHQETTENKEEPKEEKPDPNTLVISKAALLILQPDSISFAKAKDAFVEEHGEDALAEVGSDEGFYLADAADFAKTKGLEVHTSQQMKIIFKAEDGKEFELTNDVQGLGADVFMFNGKDQPQKVKEVATFSSGEEYKAYFGEQ